MPQPPGPLALRAGLPESHAEAKRQAGKLDYSGLEDFLGRAGPVLARGPVAVLLVEDPVEIASTLIHLGRCGFRATVVLLPAAIPLPPDLPDGTAARLHVIRWNTTADATLTRALNPILQITPETTWLHYCYNAEYLLYPFCETRSIGEVIAFQTEERRDSILTYVVDLYAPDLGRNPNAVNIAEAMLDRSGYYALARPDPKNQGHPKERQLDFFGGLRWRFEEHIPKPRRRIDRIGLFRAQKGLMLREDHTFSIEEYNTYACPWHNNLTAAIASFRTAKALKTNPGSTFDIPTFQWHNSVPFGWESQQLMDLGLMEPGQWF